MRLLIAAIGRLKAGPERELAERFRERTEKSGRGIGIRTVEIVEIRESSAPQAERRMLEESVALANLIPDGAVTVILDEKGDNLDSATLAADLRTWCDTSRPVVVFAIGGPDGLAPQIKKRANIVLAFGRATWPHQLVRIMLLEQLYRATTILAGHPYHRA
jgi:23S rRNA (pseudouridine1915-N3)-methyltransferase